MYNPWDEVKSVKILLSSLNDASKLRYGRLGWKLFVQCTVAQLKVVVKMVYFASEHEIDAMMRMEKNESPEHRIYIVQ